MSSRETIARLIACRAYTGDKTDPDKVWPKLSLQTQEWAFALVDEIAALSEGKSATEGEWRPIEEHQGHGPVLVSTAPDSPKYLFSEPVSAFLDVTGVWRCLGSIGGGAELARQPTHFRPLPASPTGEDR